VRKGISTDSDSAKKIIFRLLGSKKEKTMTIDDFNKVFCKCIFKESLIHMFESIEKATTNEKGTSKDINEAN
jgi:hypothetical protein